MRQVYYAAMQQVMAQQVASMMEQRRRAARMAVPAWNGVSFGAAAATAAAAAILDNAASAVSTSDADQATPGSVLKFTCNHLRRGPARGLFVASLCPDCSLAPLGSSLVGTTHALRRSLREYPRDAGPVCSDRDYRLQRRRLCFISQGLGDRAEPYPIPQSSPRGALPRANGVANAACTASTT